MTKNGEFKSSKVRWRKVDSQSLYKRNSLIFCSFVLLICSIVVAFVQGITEWMRNLFLNYSNLQQSQHTQEFIWESIILTWNSFSNIKLSFYSEPTYIVAWWDVMLSRNIWYLAKKQWYDRIFREWNYNPLSKFEKCMSDNCLLFLNLESLFCEPDNDIQMWGFDFRSNPENIKTLMQYREDKPLLLALPNNHFSNWWYLWLTITKEILDKNWIYYVWAWLSEDESRKIFTWKNNWINFCLWAYSYDGKCAKIRWWTVYWNRINEKEIKSDLEKMKNMGCDVKIISLHRWSEYRFSPNNWQRTLAHNLIDYWADLILWWHSHIPWEFERREFNYFYDADLKRNNVPTYISMLIWLKFEKKLIKWVDIKLDQIEFNSTTDGIFSILWEETRNNLLDKINHTNISL